MNCISNISFVIVAAFGGYFAYTGLITIGTISAFIIYAKQFSRPINESAQLYGTSQTAVAGAERVFALLDQPDEDNSGTKDMEQVKGEISFRNVDFSYVEGKKVLHDFNLDVKPGQKIALVGSTGSGKTTFCEVAKDKGIEVINCDAVAREVSDGGELFPALTEAFGSDIIEGGILNRRRLAERAFASKEKTELLNSIMLPAIAEKIDAMIGDKTVILDALCNTGHTR